MSPFPKINLDPLIRAIDGAEVRHACYRLSIGVPHKKEKERSYLKHGERERERERERDIYIYRFRNVCVYIYT